MNRLEFLKSLGLKGASLMAVYCAAQGLSSCKSASDDGATPAPKPSATVDFTLDLSQASNANLNKVGGFVVANQVVVARVSSSAFAAVTQICSHEGNAAVQFMNGNFVCNVHGAAFDTNGKGLNSLGSKGLTVYKTSLSNNQLRVFA